MDNQNPTKLKNQLETQRKYILNLINQQEIMISYIKDLENKLKLNNCKFCVNRQLEISELQKEKLRLENLIDTTYGCQLR